MVSGSYSCLDSRSKRKYGRGDRGNSELVSAQGDICERISHILALNFRLESFLKGVDGEALQQIVEDAGRS